MTKRQKHTCPICEESVLDSRHDSIYCESSCDAWLCRFDKKLLHAIKVSLDPFFCPLCRLHRQDSELASLKFELASLKEKLDCLLKEKLYYCLLSKIPRLTVFLDLLPSPAMLKRNHGSQQPTTQRPTADRRQNLVFFIFKRLNLAPPIRRGWNMTTNLFATIDLMVIFMHPFLSILISVNMTHFIDVLDLFWS